MKTKMFANQSSRRRPSHAQRGQSIVVALLVLLLLGLAGALFVTIVARNIINANHANRVITADQYGRAGIAYADAQLSNSLDGADWRPPLQVKLADGVTGPIDYRPKAGTRERTRYDTVAGTLPLASADDPDKAYLEAGYSRYNTGAGRFLLRLTYDPVNIGPNGVPAVVPPGKYIKIESIGREGTIDPIDPTTYINNRSTDRTQAYQMAFKPLGITDYARFETNPDKRSDIANLGVISEYYASDTDGGIATPGATDFVSPITPVPSISEYPVLTTYGAADAYNSNGTPNPNAGASTTIATGNPAATYAGGGSIHANMPLRFFGKNVIYLHDAGAGAPLFQDNAEVAGDLLLDSYDQKASLDNATLDTSVTPNTGQKAALILNPTSLTTLKATPTNFIAPSNGSFDTHGGLVRDGSMQNDPEGLPRGITRLEPPLMDSLDSASQLPRYKALAMTSPARANLKNPDGTAYTPAANAPSPSLYGYGKAIYIDNTNDIQQDSASIGGSTTLTDEWLHGNASAATGTAKGNWNGHFYDPPGVSIILGQQLTPAAGATPGTFGIRLIRSAGDHWVGPDGVTNAGPQLDVTYNDLGSEATNANLDTGDTTKYPDNNSVIYAEGNVRVRGTLSPNEGTAAAASVIPRHITIVTNGTAYIEGNLLKGDPDSSITVLAHDYVCVNTTQFLAGPTTQEPPALQIGSNLLQIDETHSLAQEFNFGLTSGTNTGSYTSAPALYLSGGSDSSSTLADLSLTSLTGTPYSITLTPQTFSSITPTRLTIPLGGLPTTLGQGDLGELDVTRDPGSEQSASPGNVLLERAAILPMDIRIEAVLYAQTRSFFVIPGDWFNSDSGDNLDSYIQTGARTGSPDERFPLYGQPIDLKITVDGSVSEARPADIAAQTEWMRKWGWIPQYHGTLIGLNSGTKEQSGRPVTTAPAIGLQIIYNPQAGYPYNPTGTAHYLRSDKFGRPLPWTPNLPVSTGLLYSGESGEPPLLQ